MPLPSATASCALSQHLEEALTGRFGLAWEARDDVHGLEIADITGEMMRPFSSRRQSITADLRARAARFEQQYGRAPSQRELAHLAQASNLATRAAKTGTLDLAEAHAGWADTLARGLLTICHKPGNDYQPRVPNVQAASTQVRRGTRSWPAQRWNPARG
jgi:TrwC relaxase